MFRPSFDSAPQWSCNRVFMASTSVMIQGLFSLTRADFSEPCQTPSTFTQKVKHLTTVWASFLKRWFKWQFLKNSFFLHTFQCLFELIPLCPTNWWLWVEQCQLHSSIIVNLPSFARFQWLSDFLPNFCSQNDELQLLNVSLTLRWIISKQHSLIPSFDCFNHQWIEFSFNERYKRLNPILIWCKRTLKC
jgi:hypothetical protein